MTDYETTIGLEVHVQLQLKSKLFAPSPFAFGGEPNTRVSVVELGLPGVLPVLNGAALDLAIRAGLALEGHIATTMHFDRKNYFYPDLPKGYQITQFDRPFCVGGRVPLGDGRYGMLDRIHLEEDAGKTTHTDAGSLVDLNRAGAALIEIVGAPDLHAAEDAFAFLTELKQIMQFAAVSTCDMEKGYLRCDANVSVRPRGAPDLGTKVEIKNLNSFRMVQRAIRHEEERQRGCLARGERIDRETRAFDDNAGVTLPMRTKEAADDYRYFPDPDLPPLTITPAYIDAIRKALPELPAARRARFETDHGLTAEEARVLVDDRGIADYFEALAAACGDAKRASNWVQTDVRRLLHEHGLAIEAFPVDPARLAAILAAEHSGNISHNAARKVFDHLFANEVSVQDAIRALGLEQIHDEAALAAVVAQVLAEHPDAVADFRAGREQAAHALLGRIMAATSGKANPRLARTLLLAQLTED